MLFFWLLNIKKTKSILKKTKQFIWLFGFVIYEIKTMLDYRLPIFLFFESFCRDINRFQSRTRLELAEMQDLGLIILFLLFLLFFNVVLFGQDLHQFFQDLLMTQKSPNTVSKRKRAWCFWNISFPETFLLVSPLLASTSRNSTFLALSSDVPETLLWWVSPGITERRSPGSLAAWLGNQARLMELCPVGFIHKLLTSDE